MRSVDLSETQTRHARSGVPVVFVCPSCHGQLLRSDDKLECQACGTCFAIRGGIPMFVSDSVSGRDELHDHANHHEREHGRQNDAHKTSQAAFFGRADLADFEIERPHGSPALYRFLLEEKFRRSVEPLGAKLDGWTALAVCGGSGMDAEFLRGAGASVISSDLSLGAAQRVQERARRHHTAIEPIVADVEHLPFADRSVDLVYVHDGLHHLEDPQLGIAEMARVARLAVCISEPAQAAATAIGIRLGIALDREDAGNRVVRLEPVAVASALESAGFHVVRADRYAMYYHHVPGRLMSLLSRRGLVRLTILAWRLANWTIGRLGNKATIVAVRRA
jgi:SAM-dependent methyltransferase